MDLDNCAKALKELGHPSRLGIYKRLVRSGHHGLPVGTLQKELEIPGSTLSHHISALVSVGLVQQKRDGRTLYCIAQFDTFNKVMEFLSEECCVDERT
ncbi:helix-turn-helix transcriptional regulator [Endozoicomonas sp. SCSIO W0465]|uniref:ArsR/SmtB family transcription factor n=1 Tax=Endozoicomonas sp. SCSIO W0465 TaxID=2918516 RepID=UPI0020753BFB|nr:metalloregulator ArsR/SmtB family transcription factor [Endozoicomonas sp. SCSIO W0465]USE36662.1 metalloregulator ArsR/SmtB family transcription factor [Endozoicomonas sp. SCSIO W0465]